MARRLVRLQDDGTLTLPAAIRRRHHLNAGDLVAVEDTDAGVLITPQGTDEPLQDAQEPQPLVIPQPTPEQLVRRQELGRRIMENRKQRVISPLTAADLVHLSRDDAFWYGDEEPGPRGASR